MLQIGICISKFENVDGCWVIFYLYIIILFLKFLVLECELK